MRVAVVDVGSNTARLLVADVDRCGGVAAVEEDRVYLRLGAQIERVGTLRRKKIDEAAGIAAAFTARAASLRAERTAVIVTAPGRQGASGERLVRALSDATGLPTRVLGADEEGRLAYEGAIARCDRALPEVVAVVDVGGGSSEVAVGTPLLGAAWVRSVDLGSLRVTRRRLAGDPPAAEGVAAARSDVERAFAAIDPPQPDVALAVGGSARAIAKVVGRTFGAADLEEVVRIFSARRAASVARTYGLEASRAETMLAGALLLAEASRRLGTPFELGRGGLREGAALALAHEEAAAAA